jgi:hypothetical protein
VNASTKVKIICPEHGIFEQTPQGHFKGVGCITCVRNRETLRSNTDEFIIKSKKIHGEIYDYSKTIYVKDSEKLIVTCVKHGDFLTTPNNHLRGKGCPKCTGRYKTKTEIINEFINVHGDKYDYSLVDFKLMRDNVKIICKEHGIFEQGIHRHKNGSNCPKCVGGVKYTLSDFITKVKEVHGNKYDYSLTTYTNANSKIKIKCREHGVVEIYVSIVPTAGFTSFASSFCEMSCLGLNMKYAPAAMTTNITRNIFHFLLNIFECLSFRLDPVRFG